MVLTQWETLCGLFFAFFEKIVVPILTSGGFDGLSCPSNVLFVEKLQEAGNPEGYM